MPHLTYENRFKIETLLAKSKSIRFIALQIGVSHTTILREIKKHMIASSKTFGIYILNNCIHRKKCSEKNICSINTRQGELPSSICKQKCSACREINCNSYCEKFVAEKCDRLINSPGVCNGCNLERKCSLSKYYYISEEAEKQYKETLSVSRKGTHIPDGELDAMDNVLYNGIKKGQSVHHIISSFPDFFN
jgi:IS30 family transposase